MKPSEVIAKLDEMRPRSAWDRGVIAYAVEVLEDQADYNDEELPDRFDQLHRLLLNGADDWNMYSWDGYSLVYDIDIAERLCTPSELKRRCRRDGTVRPPDIDEEWPDTQARALHQAEYKILTAMRKGA